MLDFASFSGCWFDDDRYYYIKPIHLRKFKNKISTIILIFSQISRTVIRSKETNTYMCTDSIK